MRSKKMLVALAVAVCAYTALPAVASAEITTAPSIDGAPMAFTATSGESVLYGAPDTVECTSTTTVGEFSGGTTGTVVSTLHGCKTIGVNCASAGQSKGTIQTEELQFHLVYLEPTSESNPHETPGILFTPAENGIFMEFTCAGGLIRLVVTGNGLAGTVSTESEVSAAMTIGVHATESGQEHTRVTTSKGVYSNVELEASLNEEAAVPAYEERGEEIVTFEPATTE